MQPFTFVHLAAPVFMSVLHLSIDQALITVGPHSRPARLLQDYSSSSNSRGGGVFIVNKHTL